VYLRRACELAERGRGSTSPNPSVGAVIALGSRTLGEGFHHVRGSAHAEVEALRDAADRGESVAGATIYVTLEPCDHTGLTPPCSRAVIAAGIERVVIGTLDPDPQTDGAGVRRLRDAGVVVVLAADGWSESIVEDFMRAKAGARPYVRLKLATSLDGYVAPRPGERHWLTGIEAREYVRELRARYDAVLVGAGTVRTDDPLLSVRPVRARRKPYVRVVAAESTPPLATQALFAPLEGYAPTIVLAPAGRRAAYAGLESVADVEYIGEDHTATLDVSLALEVLRARGIASILCEGGPTLASRMLESDLVDRVDWLVAPAFLSGPGAIPALANAKGTRTLRFDRVEALGADVLLSAVLS
jgi:diaminohydroxyphosphoribosylaminopyrimidine deaminase/5-amino-6-(5-phosphoribosylamino)uracil reductase